MSFFAERLKDLRISAGLSMQELADNAGVSKSMICKIESDKVQPTIDVAGKLSKALGKTLSEMLHATHEVEILHITQDQQAIWKDPQGVSRRNISPIFDGLKMEWLQVELPPKTQICKPSQMISPNAEKYLLINKGKLEIKINNKTYTLNKGDSFYFGANIPHEFINNGKITTEFYIVIKHG